MSSTYQAGYFCDRGVGPEAGGREANEDNFIVCLDGRSRMVAAGRIVEEELSGKGQLFAVADGMGGHEHGALASAAAVQALTRLFRQDPGDNAELALHTFFIRAHHRLRERAREKGAANMGTTLSAVWVHGAEAAWAHVGDSRLYHMRGGTLITLTRDHTRGEFAWRDGRPTPVEARALTQNFIFGSRGFGHDEDVRIDAGTDTGTLTLFPGDRLLLCTDGVHGSMQPARIRDLLSEGDDPQAQAEALCTESMANGAVDNVTAVVVHVIIPSGYTERGGEYREWRPDE
jgi:serine/threonine protein phosphatase PrpC